MRSESQAETKAVKIQTEVTDRFLTNQAILPLSLLSLPTRVSQATHLSIKLEGSDNTTFTSGLIFDQYKYNDNDYEHICVSLPSRLNGNNDEDVPLMLFFKRIKFISIVMSCSFSQ